MSLFYEGPLKEKGGFLSAGTVKMPISPQFPGLDFLPDKTTYRGSERGNVFPFSTQFHFPSDSNIGSLERSAVLTVLFPTRENRLCAP
jgi:hypothetical protein